MSPTPIMIAIFFAPKERASVSARSVAWVVLLSCCMIVCWGNHRQINQTVNAFGVISTTCVTLKSMAADSSRYTC